jgi:hypothetical protein
MVLFEKFGPFNGNLTKETLLWMPLDNGGLFVAIGLQVFM